MADGFKTLSLFFILHVAIESYLHPERWSAFPVISELYMLLLCGAAVIIMIRMYNDENKTWLLQRKLELQANQDGLTRLANLRSFLRLAGDTLDKRRIAIFMIDIDNFKQYNDRYGHLAGDDLLREVGQLLRNAIEPYDYVARYGGEEFILMSHYTDPEALSAYAARLCETVLAQTSSLSGESAARHEPVTISIGIAIAERPGDSLQRLISEADEALYESKRSGKNRSTLHTPYLAYASDYTK
jgi:diguanylate cyclase